MSFKLPEINQSAGHVSYYDYASDTSFSTSRYFSALLEQDKALKSLFNQGSSSGSLVRFVINDADFIDCLADIDKALSDFAANKHFIICELALSQAFLEHLISLEQCQQLRDLCALCDVIICSERLLSSITDLQVKPQQSLQDANKVIRVLNIQTLIIENTDQTTWFYLDADRQASFSSALQETQQASSARVMSFDNQHLPGQLSAAFACFKLFSKRNCDSLTLALAYINQQDMHIWPSDLSNFGSLNSSINAANLPAFASTNTQSLGLYPVVDSLLWLEKLLDQGIKTIQLRVKNVEPQRLDSLIEKAALIGEKYNARLFINDYWQLAIKHRCYGVHLGQEDLCSTDLVAIQKAGLRLGVSTHSEYEWLRALAIRPSYIAMGTVYTTQTKPAILIGLTNLRLWSKILADHIPLVAIGGIKLDNIDPVLKSGVGSIAVVTAITLADDYQLATQLLKEKQQRQFRCD